MFIKTVSAHLQSTCPSVPNVLTEYLSQRTNVPTEYLSHWEIPRRHPAGRHPALLPHRPHHLAIVNPGETPSPLHWRFYLRSPHTVVRRLSQVPARADFLLVPTRQTDSPEQRQRITRTLGFRHEILRFTDALGNDFTLWSR